MTAAYGSEDDLDRVDREADLILLSREALALGLDERFARPERIREWTYEFDPSGLELLRRAIDRALAARQAAGTPGSASTDAGSAVVRDADPPLRKAFPPHKAPVATG